MTDASPPPTGLARRAMRSAAWIVAGRLVMRVLGLVNTIVLARLLVPEDFGLVAIGLTAMQFLQGVSDIGAAQAVIRFRNAGRAVLDTLFTFSAARGAAIALLLAGAGPAAAGFYGDPRLAAVFAGAALAPLLNGFVNPRFYEFERELDLSRDFIVSALNKLAGVAASVGVALLFRSYWAIVAGVVAGAAVQLALSYAVRPYAPRMTVGAARDVFGFSGWLAAVSIVAAFNNKLDAFILGRAIGTSATGVFYVGRQLAELPTSELASPIARALYPGLTALQADSARMKAGFLKGVEALGAAALPASVGFAFLAPDLTRLLLGPGWEGSAHVVAVLAPVLGVQALFLAAQYLAMALGLTRLVFVRELIFFLIRTPLLVWAAFKYGLEGAAWAVAGTGAVHIVLNLALYARAAGRPFWEPLFAARRSLGATAAMAVVLAAVQPAIHGIEAPQIVLMVALGGAAYAAALFALWSAQGRPDGIEKTVLAMVQKTWSRRSRR